MPLEVQYVCYIPCIILQYCLFNDITYVKVTWTDTMQAESNFENFPYIFLTGIFPLIFYQYI